MPCCGHLPPPPPPPHPPHTRRTTCLLLSSQSGPRPLACSAAPSHPHPGCLISLEINHIELGSPTNPSSKHASQTAPFTPQGPLQVNKAWEEPGNKTGLVQQGQPLPSGLLGGNLWPPPCSLLPLLLLYPTPGLCSDLEPTPDLVKVRQPRLETVRGSGHSDICPHHHPTPPHRQPCLLSQAGGGGGEHTPRWQAHGKGYRYS